MENVVILLGTTIGVGLFMLSDRLYVAGLLTTAAGVGGLTLLLWISA